MRERPAACFYMGAFYAESLLFAENGNSIGAIQIADRFALVDVPDAAADRVIQALRGGSLKGRKVTVRRDRGPVPPGAKPRKGRP